MNDLAHHLHGHFAEEATVDKKKQNTIKYITLWDYFIETKMMLFLLEAAEM